VRERARESKEGSGRGGGGKTEGKESCSLSRCVRARETMRENVREGRVGGANLSRRDTCLCSRCTGHARYSLKSYRKNGCIRSNMHPHNMFDILLLNIHLGIVSATSCCKIRHPIRCDIYIFLCCVSVSVRALRERGGETKRKTQKPTI